MGLRAAGRRLAFTMADRLSRPTQSGAINYAGRANTVYHLYFMEGVFSIVYKDEPQSVGWCVKR